MPRKAIDPVKDVLTRFLNMDRAQQETFLTCAQVIVEREAAKPASRVKVTLRGSGGDGAAAVAAPRPVSPQPRTATPLGTPRGPKRKLPVTDLNAGATIDGANDDGA